MGTQNGTANGKRTCIRHNTGFARDERGHSNCDADVSEVIRPPPASCDSNHADSPAGTRSRA